MIFAISYLPARTYFRRTMPSLIRWLCLCILWATADVRANGEEAISITWRNELPLPVSVYFEGTEQRILQGEEIPAQGGELTFQTFPGHKFTYDYGGERHWIDVPEGQPEVYTVLLGGKTEITVRCSVTTSGFTEKSQPLDIRVVPWWSPRGASRFLNLVRTRYYDGCGVTRVIPHFLTQFGISADYDLRTEARNYVVKDDPVPDTGAIKFVPGMMSFAGAGPNTRSAEVFIVMPDTPQGQLNMFGSNPWETPFGVINNVEDTPVSTFFSYGDFFPPGKGPHPAKIYPENGYEFLAENFPRLDYIEECIVVEDSPITPEGNEL